MYPKSHSIYLRGTIHIKLQAQQRWEDPIKAVRHANPENHPPPSTQHADLLWVKVLGFRVKGLGFKVEPHAYSSAGHQFGGSQMKLLPCKTTNTIRMKDSKREPILLKPLTLKFSRCPEYPENLIALEKASTSRHLAGTGSFLKPAPAVSFGVS